MEDRDRLGRSFDAAASRYQEARPEYPPELFESLVDLADLQTEAWLLEIGCATGKATIPLAERGFHITAIEPGPALAARARHNLAKYENVDVVLGTFEEWEPNPRPTFDLVFAATAWHWIDPAVRYAKAAALLRPGGHLAFWSAIHAFPKEGDPFFRDIQDLYEAIGDGLPEDAEWPSAEELPDDRTEIESTGLFDEIHVRRFGWEIDYDADAYIELLETFSANLVRQQAERDLLYSGIRQRLAGRANPVARRGWGAVLHVARRRS